MSSPEIIRHPGVVIMSPTWCVVLPDNRIVICPTPDLAELVADALALYGLLEVPAT